MRKPLRLAMWSGPRNLSTTLMRSFASRADTSVVDEPFYAAYLRMTGLTHPMVDDILACHESDPVRVIASLTGDVPAGRAVFYQKHMVHHMIEPIPMDWLDRIEVHVMLIRHPARVVASYHRKMENLSSEAMGFPQQETLLHLLAGAGAGAPLVVDADTILSDPEGVLRRLCAVIRLDWDPAMLSWPAGRRPEDGVWAAHWYDAVWQSTGFGPPSGPLPELTGEAARIADEAMGSYQALLARHI